MKTTIYVRLITTTSDKDAQETLQRAGWTGIGQWGEEMNFFWDTRIQGWPPNPEAHR